jgi:glutamate/aspartate transport system permease protein
MSTSTPNPTWNWQVFCQNTIEDTRYASCFGPQGETTYLDWMLSAWGWTLTVSLCALAVALVFGVMVGVARTVPNRGVRWAGEAWTELFRNIPLLVQIFLWNVVLPRMVPALGAVPGEVMAVAALGFFSSARVAEQVKAGILSLPTGQRYAGLAMGLTLPQTYRHVLLPVAFRVVIPPITSEAMSVVKNSPVAFAVSVAELTMFLRQASEDTQARVEMYLAVTGLYFISAFVVNRVFVGIERWLKVPGVAGMEAK